MEINKLQCHHCRKHKLLAGKKVFITGGTKGIGWAIAQVLEKNGADVYVCGRDKKRVDEINEAYYGNITAIKKDVEDELDMISLNEIIQDIDILINNVGGGGTWKSDDWDIVMYKNYIVTYALTMGFLKGKRDWGRVITISSIYGKERGDNPGFVASKAAQIAFMKSLSGKVMGCTFNTICPGEIDVGKKFKKGIVPGKPEDVADIVTFLCSDKASHINGAVITVDGGKSHSF